MHLWKSLPAVGLALALALPVAAEDYTLQSFQDDLARAVNSAEVIGICGRYVENSQDFELLGNVQEIWKEADPEGAMEFFAGMYEEKPESPSAACLLGVMQDDPLKRIEYGRKAIELDGEFKAGYMLVAETYWQGLFRGRASDEEIEKLAAELQGDEEIFAGWARLDPEGKYTLRVLSAYQAYREDYEAALKTVETAAEKGQRWADGYASYILAEAGRFDEIEAVVAAMIDREIENGEIEKEDREDEILSGVARALRSAKAYDRIIELYKSKKGYRKDPDLLYNLAFFSALNGDQAAAVKYLETAAKRGFDKAELAVMDSDLESLHDNPRWEKIIAKFKNNWEKGEGRRKSDALAGKIDEPAPEWKLLDAAGNTVSLSGLRGNIVVLDFWATWCGPCRRAMPMIDKFTRVYEDRPVRVFSINVWENNPPKAKAFMEEHGYAMQLLFGTGDLPETYGVTGIPTIFIIDKEGNIRYREVGVEEGLDEKLTWWADDLLQ